MSFSCKVILAGHQKADGCRRVYLQAIIDRKRALVSLDFYLKSEDFDGRRQCVKDRHPNAKDYNKEFLLAVTKGNSVASRFRIENRTLTPEIFRKEFADPTGAMDFIKFVKTELELKRPSISDNTYRQHLTVINKLSAFRPTILFSHISVELMQQFKNTLIKDKKDAGAMATAEKVMKIVKQYLGYAQNKDYAFKDPFRVIKIKTYKSNRLGLSAEELERLEKYYDSESCLPHHKKLLRYFLFSCWTGLRISDVSTITWNNIHDDLLIYVPVKTKYQNQSVTMPLLPADKKYLPEFKNANEPIFDTFADAVSNRYLKEIAKLSSIDIKKNITYHTSRHTFASLFAEGGDVVALQQLMGHGDIKTTMGYVHTNVKALVDAKRKRFADRIPANM